MTLLKFSKEAETELLKLEQREQKLKGAERQPKAKTNKLIVKSWNEQNDD